MVAWCDAEGVLVAKKDFYSVWTYKSKDGEKDKVSQ